MFILKLEFFSLQNDTFHEFLWSKLDFSEILKNIVSLFKFTIVFNGDFHLELKIKKLIIGKKISCPQNGPIFKIFFLNINYFQFATKVRHLFLKITTRRRHITKNVIFIQKYFEAAWISAGSNTAALSFNLI